MQVRPARGPCCIRPLRFFRRQKGYPRRLFWPWSAYSSISKMITWPEPCSCRTGHRTSCHSVQCTMNLRSIDLNLLVVFDAIIRERSVTTAANQLAMTPSAVSHALSRLRVILNDEIIRRTPRGFEPTPRALQLSALIGEGLKTIEWAIEDQESFEPLHSKRTLTLHVSDYVGVFLLPPLCERLRKEAPHVRLIVERLSLSPERTDPGEIQLRVGWMPRPYDYRRQLVFEDEFVVVMRHDHDAAHRPLSLEAYIELPHLKVSPAAIGTSMIDDALAKRGHTRNVVVTVANWFEVAPIVERTDLVAVVPRRWAEIDRRVSRLLCRPLPLDDVKFTVDQCWHPSNDSDLGHRWFRSLIAEIFNEAQGASFSSEAVEAGTVASLPFPKKTKNRMY